jgi:tRNA pseudouridine55 synthase
MGHRLGVGGHLTQLRRTRVGSYRIEDARTLEQLAERFDVVPLDQAAQAAFPRRDLSADEARRLAHGGRLAPAAASAPAPGPTAAYAPDGTLIALVTEESGEARPLVVFAEG